MSENAGGSSRAPTAEAVYDVFLSHGSPDAPWVRTLAEELQKLGLRPFLDRAEIGAGDSFPAVLSRGLGASRFLVLVLSPHSDRPWVHQEWQAFLAQHGPQGRLLPVLLESTETPPLLASYQRIDALDRDAARVAREIALVAGRPSELKEGDTRRLVVGQDLVFSLGWEGDGEIVTLWCQEVEQQADRAEGLVAQLLDACRKRFGLDWEPVVQQVDRAAGADPARRFTDFLEALLERLLAWCSTWITSNRSLSVLRARTQQRSGSGRRRRSRSSGRT
jgi:hypothetical protein